MKKFIQILIIFLFIFNFTVFAISEEAQDRKIDKNLYIQNKLVFDAKNRKVVNYKEFINEIDYYDEKYLYSVEQDNFEIIVINLPKEYVIQIVTIKDINKNSKSFTISENSNKYFIDDKCKMEFVYKNDNNIANFDNIEKDKKLLLYLDNYNNVKECFITPFKSLDKSIVNNKAINIEGRFIEEAPYFLNDELYLPIRPIAEAFNYNLYWDSNLKIVILKKDGKRFIINTKYDGILRYGLTYVTKDFIEKHLKINIKEKDNIIYVG